MNLALVTSKKTFPVYNNSTCFFKQNKGKKRNVWKVIFTFKKRDINSSKVFDKKDQHVSYHLIFCHEHSIVTQIFELNQQRRSENYDSLIFF